MKEGEWVECPNCKVKGFVQAGFTEITIRCHCGHLFEVKLPKIPKKKKKEESGQ